MSETFTSESGVNHHGRGWWFRLESVAAGFSLLSPTLDLRRGMPPEAADLPVNQNTDWLPTRHLGEVWELSFFTDPVGLAIPFLAVLAGPTQFNQTLQFFGAIPGTPGVVGGTLSGLLVAQFCQFRIDNVDGALGATMTGGIRVRPA